MIVVSGFVKLKERKTGEKMFKELEKKNKKKKVK